ncbi:hypothetical protein KBD61_01195 [Patescibacteria group bacterium]|nr:hypothetical protein [Patescibacteria group bacterium]
MPSADGWESDWAMTVSSLGLTEGEVAELVPTFFRKPPVFQCGDRVLYVMVDPDSGAVTFHSVIVERHTFV